MGCQHLDEYYELCLLGATSVEACGIIAEHAERGCPYCLAHLREAARTVYLLCRLAPDVRPRPRVKAQILRRLRKK